MDLTNSNVIKLPSGYILKKIDNCTYELVKLTISRKEISCLLKAGQDM